ncbi:MAG: serine/threonine-protein kinase [Planctomycetales bacterium]|nr:serine/threonine-protein kinase [Planctomycetales bacterium]
MEPRDIGPYRVLSELGRGGFATVFRARDSRDGREVALKVLRTGEGGPGPDDLRRFRREIEAARALEHSGIARVIDASPGESDPPWVAMELIEGEPLSARIAREPLPWRQAVTIARDVADALAAAHARGILHRDVKPSNILLDRDGRPHVVDFGLAKLTAHGSKLTKTGEALGTPTYMSPEQARGEVSSLAPATDVWSLGCVLYEMLAGRPPFEGDTAAAVVGQALVREPVRPRQIRSDIPADLERVVRVCLAKRVRDRYPNAEALGTDLERVLQGQRPRARLPGAWRWRAALAGIAGAAVVWGLALARRQSEAPALAPPSADAPGAEVLAARAAVLRPGDPAAAAEVLRRALAAASGDLGLRVLRADCLREAGAWLEAEAEYGRVLEVEAGHVRARFGRGLTRWLARQAGEGGVGDPGEDLTGVARDEPGAQGAVARAILAIHSGRWDEGERQIAAAGEGWEACLVRGLLWHHFGEGGAEQQRRAVLDFGAAIERGPPSAHVRFERGHAKYLLGDTTGAIEDWNAILVVDPRHKRALVSRGVARQSVGDIPGAIADYGAALAIDPRLTQALWSRGDAKQIVGDYEGAIEDYDAALALDPRAKVALNHRGLAKRAAGDIAGAIADYDVALALDPQDKGVLNNRGLARRAAGDITGAIADYDAALAVDPRYLGALVNRGVARESSGDVAGAIGDYDAALAMDPACKEALYSRAGAKQAVGDPAGAIADYGAALAVDPRYTQALVNRGNARRALGDIVGAIEDYEKALEIAPPDWPDRKGVEGNLRSARALSARGS